MFNSLKNFFVIVMSMSPLLIPAISIGLVIKSRKKNSSQRQAKNNMPFVAKERIVNRLGENSDDLRRSGKGHFQSSDSVFMEDKENDWLARQMREENELLRRRGRGDVIESRAARRNYFKREEYTD